MFRYVRSRYGRDFLVEVHPVYSNLRHINNRLLNVGLIKYKNYNSLLLLLLGVTTQHAISLIQPFNYVDFSVFLSPYPSDPPQHPPSMSSLARKHIFLLISHLDLGEIISNEVNIISKC